MGQPNAVFREVIPQNKRPSREEMIKTANYYCAGLQRNDGKGHYPFTDDCVRFENGIETTTQCKKQFEQSLKGVVSRIRDRRFVNGQIRRIEAVFQRAPCGINSGWSTYEQGMSGEPQIVR